MKLTEDTKEKIFNHALQEYPDECCGIVTGYSDKQRVHPCENIQNRLHAENPERFQRDARTAYVIERSRFNNIISSAKEKGEDIIAFYHSHPEHEAFFSEEDFAAQTVFGEPEFPEVIHVVVSVMDGKIHDIKCYKWDGAARVFNVIEYGY